MAWDCGATPILVLSKAYLVADPAGAEGLALAENPGMEVFAVSVTVGDGIDALRRRRFADQTAVLLGESGSGKSTLTNALLGRDSAKVGAVRAGDHEGRHTTTDRHLFDLPSLGV